MGSWREYYELCKPKVVYLIMFTAFVGMLLSTKGPLPWDLVFWGMMGIGLAAASGAAVNHWVDQKIDALMERTEKRPLPQGTITTRSALTFAISLGVIAMAILLIFVNVFTAVLTFFALIGYAVIYTMFLKRTTPQNIVLGGAAGAAPPALGWCAITGDMPTEALLLFLIIFVWTPPHFWALAIKRRVDYAKAGIPMLPVTHGVLFTKLHIVLYTILLVGATLMPFMINMSGELYLFGAVILGIGFLVHAIRLYRLNEQEHESPESDAQAMKTFAYSIFYLNALFAFLLVDHYAREFIRGFLMG